MVLASLAVRPALRAFAPRTADCFEDLADADLAPRSDAEPATTGAVEAAWAEEPGLNVEAAWILFDSAGAVVLTGEAVETAPSAAGAAPACATGAAAARVA